MKNDKEIHYKPVKYIKSAFTEDNIGTTPNENRIFIIGILPAAFGLMGSGMSIYLYLFSEDDRYCTLPGFMMALSFGWYAQISMRRTYQMRDRDRRIVLIEKLRIIPTMSVLLAVVGLAITLAVWFFPPHAAPRTFYTLVGGAIIFPIVGILLTPFSFAARRIGWLVNPR